MSSPVFVDPTGRRLGALRLVGRLAGVGLAGYVLLVVASLVAPPGLDRIQVPGVGPVVPAQRAPEIVTTDGDEEDAADAVDDARRAGAGPNTGPARGQTGTGVEAPETPRPTPVPTPRPTATPVATPVRGKPTAPPGQATTPPGSTSGKPTAKGKPTARPTTPGNSR